MLLNKSIIAEMTLSQFKVIGYSTHLVIHCAHFVKNSLTRCIYGSFAHLCICGVCATVYGCCYYLSFGVYGDVYHHTSFVLHIIFGTRKTAFAQRAPVEVEGSVSAYSY